MSEIIEELKNEAEDAIDQSKEALLEKVESSKEYFNSSTVPLIVGALAVGFVLGLVVQREKSATSMLDGRIEELKELLGSLKNKVSSSAGDGYSEVSSAIGDVVKKARQRLHIS